MKACKKIEASAASVNVTKEFLLAKLAKDDSCDHSWIYIEDITGWKSYHIADVKFDKSGFPNYVVLSGFEDGEDTSVDATCFYCVHCSVTIPIPIDTTKDWI